MFSAQIVWKGIVYSILMIIAKGVVSLVIYSDYFLKVFSNKGKTRPSPQGRDLPLRSAVDNDQDLSTQEPNKPPHEDAMLVGFAMIARGEIGFLIASLSQSSGTLTFENTSGDGGESIFLIIIWAVVICTILGPVAVGVMVRMKQRRSVESS